MATQELGDELRERLGSLLEEHVSLRDRLAFPIGGVADWYSAVHAMSDLLAAIRAARELAIPFVVVGTGSQTVVSDFGFAGLVIHNQTDRIECIPQTGQVIVDSGVRWPQLVIAGANLGLGGLEAFLPLPGTIGGALITHRLTPSGSDATSMLRRVTVLTKGDETVHQTRDGYLTRPRSEAILLVATLQFVHTRRDELMRRISLFEKDRRRYAAGDRRWLGPVFSSDLARADQSYLQAKFDRAKVLGLQSGGAVFSATRPNYIEARGRVTAWDVRQLVSQVFDQLVEVIHEDLAVDLDFIGNWEHERSRSESASTV